MHTGRSRDIVDAPSPGFLGLFRKKGKVRVRLTDRPHIAAFVCQNLLDKSALSATATVSVCSDQSEIDISGPDVPMVIGRKGQTLDALQYLTVAITDRFTADRTAVVFDCDNYRQKRKSFIRRLAERLGTQAKQSGKPVTVPPLPPRERRMMHVALQNNEALDIKTLGLGFERKMVISPRRG